MPRTAIAIVGANFGDEGKGLLTDYFAHAKRSEQPLVIRHNGGAQAGHTVVTPEGRRHVFSHFGAGTLAGAPTFLSRAFIVNPLLWVKESLELADAAPRVYVSPTAIVTTPFDMLINRVIEETRQKVTGQAHGSCGIGINETVVRCASSPYRLRVADLVNMNERALMERLGAIRDQWLPHRLSQLDVEVDQEDEHFQMVRHSHVMLQAFVDAAKRFVRETLQVEAGDLLGNFNTLIFEGAQGLCLDQGNATYFPHVTRSATGLQNVMTLLRESGLVSQIKPVFASRAYLTRHGNGRLPGEDPNLSYEDHTNAPNQYQGRLRFAPLNAEQLYRGILGHVSPYALRWELALTHLDQMPDRGEAIVRDVRRHFGNALTLGSYGPTRNDVTVLS